MISIRGGMGLGDALYVQAVARHLVGQGQRVEVCTKWPEVFRPLGGRVTCSPFRRRDIDRIAHYSQRRHIVETDQFLDCCIQSGIREPVDLRLDWEIRNPGFVSRLRGGAGRPVIAVALPRTPMDRTDGYGDDLLPDCRVIQRAIDRLRGRAFLVQIGKGVALHKFDGIDLDLANRTTVDELLDVANAADGFLGYVSFIVPLAESLSKPALLVWSRRGLNSTNEIIRWLTPRKVLHGPLSRVVIDDCPEHVIIDAADEFCEQVRRPVAA